MDIDETQMYAGEYTINALCGGDAGQFRGLGSVARYLVQVSAQGASENAKTLTGSSIQIPEGGYDALRKRCEQEFVLAILGQASFVDEKGLTRNHRTPPAATAHLVEDVWNQYILWARESS